MKYHILYIALFFSFLNLKAQEDFIANDIRINKFVEGTLLAPREKTVPLAIIINGSGPTDRDGNQMMTKNDAAKKLAKGLAEKGIATFRYDKRTLKIRKLDIKEEDMRFDDFIEDANAVIKHFKPLPHFSKIIVIGHSQGSLVGMVAAQDEVDGFVSIAGAGQSIDNVIVEQIGRQMPGLKENTRAAFDELKEKGKTKNYSPALESIFRESVQPFILSWAMHDPQEEIKKLEIPVLIINGDNDLQASPEEAKLLKDSLPNAELLVIENMNHVFRIIDKNDDIANQKSYNEPQRPISQELVEAIANFILK